jgi:hypothetical protein
VKEVDANKTAWELLLKDSYEYCKKALQENWEVKNWAKNL